MNVAKSFRCFTSSYLLKGLTTLFFLQISDHIFQKLSNSNASDVQTVLQLSSVLNLTTLHPKHLSSATMVNIVDLHDFLPLFVNWKIIYQLLSCNFPVFYPTKVSRKKISIKPFIQRLQPCEPLEFRIDSTIMVYYESPSSLHHESDQRKTKT